MSDVLNMTQRRGHFLHGLMVLLAAGLLLAAAWFANPSEASAAGGYEPSTWAKDEVEKAYDSGLVPHSLMSDYQKPITRAEMSRVIVRLYEKLTGDSAPAPASNPFRDTKDESVLKAYELGIVKGTSANTFSPDAPITREQIAVMLMNTLEKAGYGDKLPNEGAPVFADEAEIAGYAKTSVQKLSAARILQGSETKDGLLFQPKATASREQIFVLAYRVADQYAPLIVRSERELLEAVTRPDKTMIIRDERTRQIYDRAVEIVSEIITPDMNEFERELAIHDYIVLNTEYDYENYLANTIPSDSYSAYGVFFKGTAVCQGYAHAAHLMLWLSGIESHIVSGTARGNSHAWNKVKIGGEYYNLDVTWDDPVPDKPGRVMYSYFNITDEELARDHKWDRSNWPAATAKEYDYFEYMGLAVHSREELKERISNAIASRDTSKIMFKAVYTDDYHKVIEDIGSFIMGAYGLTGYEYYYYRDQLVFELYLKFGG